MVLLPVTQLSCEQDIQPMAGSHEESKELGDNVEVDFADGSSSAAGAVHERRSHDEGSEGNESDRHGIAAQREAARLCGLDEVRWMLTSVQSSF